jgi:predicted nucleic acid-binding protein
MKRLRVYVDTSVIGGCFDPEFATWSTELVAGFRMGRFAPVLSDVTAAEVALAPRRVRDLHQDLVALAEPVLPVTKETLSLVADYQARGVLGSRFRNDMLHIAIASIAEVDVLVSWNFKHIVRLDKIRLFNAVNFEGGYKALAIYSPREVAGHEGD